MNKIRISMASIIGVVAITIGSCNSRQKPDAYGNFEATEVMVSSQGNGQIMSLRVEEGDKLDSARVIGIIDTLELSLNRQQLQRSMKALEAQLPDIPAQVNVLLEELTKAEIDQRRTISLNSSEAATQQQLDDANSRVAVLKRQIHSLTSSLSIQTQGLIAQMDPIRSQIAIVDDQIRKSHITMPINGTVLNKYAEAGEVTSYGKPIMLVSDLREIKLRAYLSEPQLTEIKLGDTVTVSADSNKGDLKSYPGVISWISSQAEFTPKVVQTKDERTNLVYAIKVVVKNDGSLKIGMPGEVRFSNGINQKR